MYELIIYKLHARFLNEISSPFPEFTGKHFFLPHLQLLVQKHSLDPTQYDPVFSILLQILQHSQGLEWNENADAFFYLSRHVLKYRFQQQRKRKVWQIFWELISEVW